MDNLVGTDLGLTAGGACSCCAHDSANVTTASASASVVRDYDVAGMTCSHCVSSVVEELSALEGVQSVSVDLNAHGNSRVTVASQSVLDESVVRRAVDVAGYTLVAAS